MKMKQIVLMAVIVFLPFVVARGDAQVLYWLVSAESIADTPYANFDYAQLYATDGSTTYALGGDANPMTSGNAVLAENNAFYFSAEKSASGSSLSQKAFTILDEDVSAWSSFSFYVELVNSASGSQWDSTTRRVYSYGDLVSEGYIVTAGSLKEVQLLSSGAGASMGAVPEPTSGLLLLVGGALLTLRRRVKGERVKG